MTREEAIDCNKNLRMYMRFSDKNQPCKFLEENYIALDMAIKALEQDPKWIPVSEELPNKEGYYLCSVRYMYPPYNFFEPEKVKYMDDVTIQKFDGEFNIEVKAWMPLPEPYIAESEV